MNSLSESVQKVAGTFEKAFGVRSFVVNAEKSDGLLQRREHFFCEQCSSGQIKLRGQLICENIHRHGAVEAERWGGKYEYLCPAGLAFICASLQKSGDLSCGIAAGPFLMVDLKDFIEEDLERFFPGEKPVRLESLTKQLPFFSSGRVSYIADVLFMLSSYAAERDSIQLRIMEQMAQSSNEVFSSLYGLKSVRGVGYSYPIEQEKMLQGYIAQGNKPAAQKVLNEILGHIFFSSGGDFEYIKARIIELIVILSRAAISGGADITEMFGLNSDYMSDIQRFTSLDELNQWLAKVLIRFTAGVFDFSEAKHPDMIKKAVAYIKQNYMNKISLNDISGHTNISVSYLSKIFKEEMDCNISAFINQVRIENAKLFLLNDEIPLTEVAYISGFEDQSYFSKVFKKVTGMTPGKFRSKKGNI